MIDQATGQLDHLAILQATYLRACREWGGPNPSPRYVRESREWCLQHAEAMARNWRRERGLPVQEAVTWVGVEEWGASGDSFAQAAE